MATKYIDSIVTNSANVIGDLNVGGTLYTSNVNGDSNFGIQMNITNYSGDVSNVSNLTIENVYGNIEIDEYSGNLADFSGNIGTIQNVSNITGNINNGVGGDVIINGSFTGNINGDILGNLEGDYNIYGNIGSISNITVNGDMSVSGNVENYHLHGNVENMMIEGNVLGDVTTGDITNYTIVGDVGNLSNITTLGNFTIEGDVAEYYNTGDILGNISNSSNITVNGDVNGNVDGDVAFVGGNLNIQEYIITGNTGDITNANVDGNINIEGNVAVINNFSGNLSTFGDVTVEEYTVEGNVGAITDSNVTVNGNVELITTSNVTVTGDLVGNITGGTTNINIDSNVLDLGASIRLNTDILPILGSGIIVANIDGDAASLMINPDSEWEFTSPTDTVRLTTQVSVDDALHVRIGAIGVGSIDITNLSDRSSHMYTFSGNENIVEFAGDNFLVSIKSVVETDIGISFLTGVISSTGAILVQESTSPSIEYITDTTGDLLISIDPGAEVVSRQTSTVILTVL